MNKDVRIGIQLLSMILIGAFLLLVGFFHDFIYDFFVHAVGLNDSSTFVMFIKNKLADCTWIGTIILFTALAVYFVATGIESFFMNRISPIVKGHVDRLSDELDKMGEDTKDLLSAKLLDGVLNSASSSEIKNKLRDIHAKAYGMHCANDQGLYVAVQNKNGKFFDSDVPHRSDYNQTITIMDNYPNGIKWHEVCGYKIHSICHDKDYGKMEEKKIIYPVLYSSIAKVGELSLDGGDSEYNLSIKVSGNEIFNTSKDLEKVSNKIVVKMGVEGVTVEQDAGSLKINFQRDIEIKEPWTEILIQETSTVYDDYLLSRRNEPTCGAKIHINLPNTWYFELIRFGHPDDWTIHQHPPNTLSASTRGWVLPGITFFCRWERPSDAKQ